MTQKIFIGGALFSGALLVSLTAWTLAQEAPAPNLPAQAPLETPQSQDEQDEPAVASDAPVAEVKTWLEKTYAWTKVPWTGDDTPYVALKTQIDGTISPQQKPASIQSTVSEYQTQARQKPLDALAQFGWAYAVYKTAQIDPLLLNPKSKNLTREAAQQKAIRPAVKALASVPFPATYEFAKLRFLLETFRFPPAELAPLGKRLVERDPKNPKMIYSYLQVADLSEDGNRRHALALAQELVTLEPKNPDYHAILGDMNGRSYAVTKNKQYKAHAIAEYQEFLRLAPANDPFRPDARSMITLFKAR